MATGGCSKADADAPVTRCRGGSLGWFCYCGHAPAYLEKQQCKAKGQSEYENLVKNSNQKKMADNRSLGSKQAGTSFLGILKSTR